MPQYNYLNLPNVMQAAQNYKAGEFNRGRAEATAQRQEKQWSDQDKLANTQFLAGSAQVIDQLGQENPELVIPAVLEISQEMLRRGMIDESKYNPEMIMNTPVEEILAKNKETLASATASLAGMQQGQSSDGYRPTAPMQNYGERQRLVQQFGENSQQVRTFDNYVRAGRIIETAGGSVVMNPASPEPSGVIPGTEAVPMREREAADAGAVQAAKEQATTAEVGPRGEEERMVKLTNTAPTAYKSVIYAISQIDRFSEQARRLRNHPGLSKATGFGGEQLSGVPGTDAADAAALMQTLKSQAFISALGAMREASKTGGAVGNVSDAEGGRFENAFVALTQAQSYPQFLEELDRLIMLNDESKNMLSNAYSTEYGQIESAPRLQSAGSTQPGQSTEGQTATNPQTGEKIIFRNGRWEPYQ